MLNWADYQQYFEPDSRLRDIYVFGCDSNDWMTLLRSVKELGDKIEYLSADRQVAPPLSFEEANATDEVKVLRIYRGQLHINLYFNLLEEVEFDIDAREVTSEADFNTIISFMEKVAAILHRDIVLTEEMSPDKVIIRIRP